MSIEAPSMRELKPLVLLDSTVNHSGIGKTEEKAKAAVAGADDVKIANIGGELKQKQDRQKPKPSESADKANEAAKEKGVSRASEKVLVAHEEPEHKQHRLTVDKLAADPPRPNVAGPLPLLHQAGLGDTYGGAAGSSAGTGKMLF